MRIRYREGRKVVQRTVDPLGLVLKGGAWYLIARRSAGMRVYRVSRVAGVRALDEHVRAARGFELADVLGRVVARVRAEPRPGRGDGARIRRGAPLSCPASRGIEEDGSVVVAFENLGDAYRELLRFGADVEVLAPLELRERVRRTSREVAALYA